MLFDPMVALAVTAASAATDFVYTMYMKEVVAKHPVRAGLLSSLYHLVAAFAIVSYTKNWIYVLFTALGGFFGVYLSVRFRFWEDRPSSLDPVHVDPEPADVDE